VAVHLPDHGARCPGGGACAGRCLSACDGKQQDRPDVWLTKSPGRSSGPPGSCRCYVRFCSVWGLGAPVC